MKKLILLALVSTFAISGFINESETNKNAKENNRLCEVFTKKVETYKSSMRNDSLAEATLVSYEERMDRYCSAPAQKAEVKTVAEVTKEMNTVLNTEEDVRLCSIFTKKEKEYESTMRNDDLAKATLSSYKHRRSAFCGTSYVKS